MAKISGKWTFNDTLTLVGNMWWVDYLGGGTECYAITIGTEPPTIKNLSLWYEAKNTSIGRIQAYMEGPGWLGNIYKTIDFGDAEQTVDDSFYEWLTANATKVLTFADKLTIITENVPKVYDAGKTAGHTAGYAEGYAEGESKGYADGKADGYTEGLNKGGYTKGYEEGKKAEYDAFWDAFQNYGNRNRYDYAFFQWGGEVAHPKYKVVPTNAMSLSQTFGESKLKKVEAAYFDFRNKPIGTYNQQSNYYTFNACRQLEEIEDIGMCDTFHYYSTFANCWKLHTISVMRVAEDTIFSTPFKGSPKLKNITIDGVIGQNGFDVSECKELSTDSIRSIISHLSDTASGKTLTLSRTAVETAIANGGFGDAAYFSTNGPGNFGYLESNPISLNKGQTIKVMFEQEPGHDDYSNYTDWWFCSAGTSIIGGTPSWPSVWTYTAANDENVVLWWVFGSDIPVSDIPIKIRVVLVDENGNELTENLHSFTTKTFTDNGSTLTIVDESWDTLVASKPNWTISLQ